MKYTSENFLLDDFRSGKEPAFAHIFHRYYNRICLFASSFVDETKEAEDLAEESFLKLWQGKRDFETLDHLKAALYQTTRRLGINYQTARLRRTQRIAKYAAEQEQVEESQLQQIVYVEAMAELHQALSKLPPKAQQIIRATYLDGKSNQEVADEMNLQLQTVKNQKLRALALLRKELGRESFHFLLAGLFLFEKM
ncbi:RNA polymerase sigma factor [Sphingobacterium sp. LRF_L2]|uniref:RNA polymerase sigma factor n=1 Tax=Sphingobacterium sp. LRF_L2 TaxID=3369421 RepID=UPI003F5F7542